MDRFLFIYSTSLNEQICGGNLNKMISGLPVFFLLGIFSKWRKPDVKRKDDENGISLSRVLLGRSHDPSNKREPIYG